MASFATEVKNELTRLPLNKTCCIAAEALALFRMSGTLILDKGRFGLRFHTKHASIARRFLSLVRQSDIGLNAETMVQKDWRLKKSNLYQLHFQSSDETVKLLERMGIIGPKGFNIHGANDKPFVRKQCCRRAYLRGAFLGSGSVNRPEGRYHLELVTTNSSFAQFIHELMESFDLLPRLIERKEEWVVYLKEGDAIIHFLQVIGALETLMAFENVRVVKEMRGNVNRVVNCETANLQKTVNASLRQMEVIEALEEAELLERLTFPLREAALLRLRHPEEPLKDLASRFPGGLSKSGLNHRMRKLEEVGAKLLEQHRAQGGK